MFREKIQEKYADLSPRFRTLADFILEDTLDVGFLTATELARRVGVDPATVVRFSQELGYSGYRELSREIKRYINQQLAMRYQKSDPETAGLPTETIALIDELSNRILEMKADAAQIAKVTESIRKAERVFITGTDDAYGLATLWTTYLDLIGISAHAVKADSASIALLLRNSEPDDLLIALSLGLDPGEEIGYILDAAAENHLSTISITTSPTLLPARQAGLNLVVPAKTPSGYPTFDTLVASLSLIWQELIFHNPSQTRMKIQSTMSILNNLVTHRDKLPPYDVATLSRLWTQD